MKPEIDPYTLTPGTVIAVRYPMYKHFAIVSDCSNKSNNDSLPLLISLSQRTGTVREEPWQIVVGNKRVEQSMIAGSLSPTQVLSRARDCLNNDINYELLTFNCEHFVRYAHGLPVESLQVRRVFYGAVMGAASCILLPKLTIVRLTTLAAIGAMTSLRSSLEKI